MKIISDPDEAKATLLKRVPWEQVELNPSEKIRIRETFGDELRPQQVVDRILADVKRRGDEALIDYTERIDGPRLTQLRVSSQEMEEAYRQIDRNLLSALTLASKRIEAFHIQQKRPSWIDFREGMGQIFLPLERVGVYVPGGKASYPSTVLMAAIPARVAGVEQIIVASPPQRDGKLSPAVLAAAHMAKVDVLVKVGGAQAIGALAFGTESVPKVDKIVGPGGLFVLLAKKSVYGAVDVDALAGPTETLIIADEKANPVWCAADLLAQAEHDFLASAILITTSSRLAREVDQAVVSQLATLSRRDIAAQSLDQRGGIIIVETVTQAIELANFYAPEHLCLVVQQPWSYIGQVRHAGGIFVGERASEALGDYVAGPSHIMPTSGTARFASPLSVDDFVKSTSLIALDKNAAQPLEIAAQIIAEAEGFTAHAQALELRHKH